MPGVIASLPPIEGLWRDAKVAVGEASIASYPQGESGTGG